MTTGRDSSTSTYRVLHLEGWTVLYARRDIDEAALSDLIPVLGTLAGPAVLDLGDHAVAEAQRADLVAALSAPSDNAGIVVVASRATERDALSALGLAQVYESLDAAVGDADAPILRQEDHVTAVISPAASDAVTVSAEDLLGRSTQP